MWYSPGNFNVHYVSISMHRCMDLCFVYSNEHTVYLCVDAVRVFLRSIVRTE